MTKEDLMPAMVVELRNHLRYVVLDSYDGLYIANEYECIYLADYNGTEYSISKVFTNKNAAEEYKELMNIVRKDGCLYLIQEFTTCTERTIGNKLVFYGALDADGSFTEEARILNYSKGKESLSFQKEKDGTTTFYGVAKRKKNESIDELCERIDNIVIKKFKR